MLKKLVVLGISLVGVVTLLFPMQSIAATKCDVCTNGSSEFLLVIDSLNDLMGAIPVKLGVDRPQKGMQFWQTAGRSFRALDQAVQTTLATTILLTQYPFQIASNYPQELIVLFQGYAIVRDWKKLTLIDKQLSTKVVDLSSQAMYFARLDSQTLANVNAIMTKYSVKNNGYIIDDYQFPQGTRYFDVLRYVRFFVTDLKFFLSLGTINSESEWGDPLFFRRMDDKYKCARGTRINACSPGARSFATKIKSTVKAGGKEAETAMKTITNSVKRLGYAFGAGKGTEGFYQYQQRQNELLRTQYGLKHLDVGQGGMVGIKNMVKSLKNVGQTLLNSATEVKTFFQSNPSTSDYYKEVQENQKSEGTDLSPFALNGKALQEQFQNTMEQGYITILALYDDEKANVVMYDSSTFTEVFGDLSTYVYDSIEVLGPLSDNQSNNTYNNLVYACDKQCSNIPGKCNYSLAPEDKKGENTK